MGGRAVVIQRRNELAECVQLLEELGVETRTVDGPLPSPEDLSDVAVVVLHGKRLAEARTPNLSLWPRTIAVVDESSRTMLAHLNRLGVALTVRRPIHRRTLRLLLLHELYRGPERRRRKRILIGNPIRVSAGLFKQRATLLELSSGGARLELPSPPKVGGQLKLLIGKELTLGKPVKLQAKVMRCIRSSGENGRAEGEIGVALVDPKKEAKTIAAILERFAQGPASWHGKGAATSPGLPAKAEPGAPAAARASAAPSAGAGIDPGDSARSLPPSVSRSTAWPDPAEPEPTAEHTTEASTCVDEAPIAEAGALLPDEPIAETSATFEAAIASPAEREEIDAGTVDARTTSTPNDVATSAAAGAGAGDEVGEAPSESDDAERRREPRIPYEERVVALDEEAARIIVGRDLSLGGMRIEACDAVGLGDVLRLALHYGTDREPLIVLASAERDDGEDGTLLTFLEPGPTQREQLQRIIAASSPIQGAAEGEDPGATTGSIVLGEMLETVRKGPVRPPDPIETEEQIDAHLDSLFGAH